MSRRRTLKATDDKNDINISPMIDMVFILLIFFIVTTVFVDEVGIEADKPRPNPNPIQKETKPVALRVTKNGQVVMDGNDIGLSGVRSNVAIRLREDPELPVIIEVERQAISGLMVRVMDEAKLAGATKLSLKAASGE